MINCYATIAVLVDNKVRTLCNLEFYRFFSKIRIWPELFYTRLRCNRFCYAHHKLIKIYYHVGIVYSARITCLVLDKFAVIDSL